MSHTINGRRDKSAPTKPKNTQLWSKNCRLGDLMHRGERTVERKKNGGEAKHDRKPKEKQIKALTHVLFRLFTSFLVLSRLTFSFHSPERCIRNTLSWMLRSESQAGSEEPRCFQERFWLSPARASWLPRTTRIWLVRLVSVFVLKHG